MLFSYDKFKRSERPLVYLAKPDKTYIGVIKTQNLVTPLVFNGISEASFKINKYENNKLVNYYDDVELLKLIELPNIGWFQITNVTTNGDGYNELKEVKALSLENELTSKLLTSFGSMGVESDENGGLDRYYLFNSNDEAHSIFHIIFEQAPTWSAGFVDESLLVETRAFNNDSVDVYSFLTNDVSKAFECIFIFDTFNKTISAYKLENYGEHTSIYLTYRNLIKSNVIESDSSNIKTVMYVAGGDDNGTPLTISDVNLSGTNMIYDFSYYKPWMSQALQNKLNEYESLYNTNVNSYTNGLATLNTLYTELSSLKSKSPDVPESTTWSQYGLKELEGKSGSYEKLMSVYMGKDDDTSKAQYTFNRNFKVAVDAEIKVRKSQIKTKETQIANQITLVQSYVLNLEDYLGTDLYKELTTYAHYTDFIDDTFITTDIMTDAERLQMKRDLLAMAQKELAKVSRPSYTMKIDAMNFTTIPEFKRYTDQLALGNIITVEYDDGLTVESRLLKLTINWDNPNDGFSMTFSSKNRLEEGWAEFAEIQSMASSAATSQAINGTGWTNAKKATPKINTYMKSALDMSLQKLKSGQDERFTIGESGAIWKRLISEDTYSPNQMWGTSNGLFLTDDNWATAKVGIGEITLPDGTIGYGIAAPTIIGDLLISQKLHIKNNNSSIVMNEDGAKFTNCDINITSGTNILTLNAEKGIELSKGTVKQFYFDAEGNITYAGKMIGGSIESSNYVLNTSGMRIGLTNGTIDSKNFKLGIDGKVSILGGSDLDLISSSENSSIIRLRKEGNAYEKNITPYSYESIKRIADENSDICSSVLQPQGLWFYPSDTPYSENNPINTTYQRNGISFRENKTEPVAWYNKDSMRVLGDASLNGSLFFISNDEIKADISCTHETSIMNYGANEHIFYVGTSSKLRIRENSINAYTTMYTSSGAVVTSDRNAKHDEIDLDERYIKLAELIYIKGFKYNDGTSDRLHIGVIAQDIEQFLIEAKIDKKDCAILCIDADGKYSIRYDELNCLMAWYHQRKVKQLEQRLTIIEQNNIIA